MTTLRTILRANAASCIVFGLIFVSLPSPIALFLSPEAPVPALVLQLTGAVLLFNGLHLVWTSLQPEPARELIVYFSTGDLLWVLTTVVLVVSGIWVTSTAGIVTALCVALLVGYFGVMQVRLRRAMCDVH